MYSHCKACEAAYRRTRSEETKKYMRTYYTDNKEHLSEQMAEHYQNHKEERARYNKAYYRARRMNNLEGDILCRCKYRAKKKGIPFNLTLEDIVIPDNCPVLGIPLDRAGIGEKGARPDSPSIDRISPELGYTKGNVRIISHRANTLKANATLEEMELVLSDLRKLNQCLSN